MIRSMSKKKFSFLFVIVGLAWCGPMSPMKNKRYIEKIDKKTIKNLSYDSLCNIFQFCSADDKKKSAAEKVAELRLVSKEFKHVIDSLPCYFTLINNGPCFLPFRFKQIVSFKDPKYYSSMSGNPAGPFYFRALLPNEESVKKFVNSPFFNNEKEELFKIIMKLRKVEQVQCLKKQIKFLISRLEKKKKRFDALKVEYPGGPENVVLQECAENFDQMNHLQLSLEKGVVSNRELNMFDNIKTLIFRRCSFANEEIQWPEGVMAMWLLWCNKFDLKRLKNLENLRYLHLGFSEFEAEKLTKGGLPKLESLSIINRKKSI